VDLFLNELKSINCDEVVLETETVNAAALRLYECTINFILYIELGFSRDKRLLNYYMNGNDAFRLKLWLNS
jgi:peptide alpha-N-acetyltransferase